VTVPVNRRRRRLAEAARRPSGRLGRLIYSAPLSSSYRRILRDLALGPGDVLLEVGPGGGVFMAQALQRAGRAAALDHSPDMVQATRRRNRAAVADGRLEVVEGDAAQLPWPDESFTAVAMNQVLFWLREPGAALAEARRVLRPGGRLAMLSASDRTATRILMAPYVRGGATLRSDSQVAGLLRTAGFSQVSVTSTLIGVQFVLATRT